MERLVHAFDLLASDDALEPPSFCVLFGDDAFLRRLVQKRIQTAILGDATDDDAEWSLINLVGKDAQWRDVVDELDTVSLFGGGQRCIVLQDAEDFVSQHRSELEELAERSAKKRSTLVLQVTTWMKTTRLAKQVAKTGLAIECRPPQRKGRGSNVDESAVAKWLTNWAKKTHKLKIAQPAIRQLIDLVGPNLGLLDQELAKLALYASKGEKVTEQFVIDKVGGWRTKTTWDLLDAAVEGNAAGAIRQLHQLLSAGESPQAMFGAFSWSLRRFAAATRAVQRSEREKRRPNLREALVQGGFRNYPKEMEKAETQLRKIGRQRGGELYKILLDADLKLKSSHSAPDRARQVLESLILELSASAA